MPILIARIMDGLRHDVRDAWRGFRRTPAFALTVVATLALGIGANAAMFNLVDRLMFRPLSYLRDAENVHRIYWQWQGRGTATTTTATQYARYLDLQKWTTSFENSPRSTNFASQSARATRRASVASAR
jgi:putative ABC transport system permease protein